MANSVTVVLDTTVTHAMDTIRSSWGYLTLSTSYSTGGDLTTPGQYGLGILVRLVIEPQNGYDFVYNATTGSVQVYTAAATEGTSGLNISTIQAKFMAWGY
jgi:hypothetical protein